MANEKSHPQAQATERDKLSSYGLDEIRYWIYTSREKFDVAKFRAAVGAKDEDNYSCVITPHDPAIGYEARMALWVEEPEITVQLIYSTGAPSKGKRKVKQPGPYAEEFGEWLGQFFKYETTQSHMHGHFSYPLATRASKFPLPLKTNIEDAEIDGVSLRLPSEPEGVSRVRLTQGDKEWYVEAVADRRITFKGFIPHVDVRVLASVINTLLEERKP